MSRRSPRSSLTPVIAAQFAVRLSLVLSLAAAPAAAQQATPGASKAPAAPDQSRLPAPYVAPAPGTREIFTNFTNVIGKSEKWRTDYTDGKGHSGRRIGLFLPDNPAASAVLDDNLFQYLWPLAIGREIRVETQRFPLKWLTKLKVVKYDTITVPAGRFAVYAVESMKQATVTRERSSGVTFTMLWYAPSIGTVVRVVSREMAGPRKGQSGRAELVRLERPGKPAVGDAATAAVAKAEADKREAAKAAKP